MNRTKAVIFVISVLILAISMLGFMLKAIASDNPVWALGIIVPLYAAGLVWSWIFS